MSPLKKNPCYPRSSRLSFPNVNSDGELEDENVLNKVRIGLSCVVITCCTAQLSEVFSEM